MRWGSSEGGTGGGWDPGFCLHFPESGSADASVASPDHAWLDYSPGFGFGVWDSYG